jgi:hypothetical protein
VVALGEPNPPPVAAQDAEECSHLLSAHFADVQVMSFRIKCLCAVNYQVIRAENDAKACIRPTFDTALGSVGSLLPAGVCYRALRRLPGQDFHLLEQRVFQDAPWRRF